MSPEEAGYRVGYAAFPLVLLAVAAFIGWRIGKKRQPPKFVGWPIGLAALLLVLGFLGGQLRKSDGTTMTSETR